MEKLRVGDTDDSKRLDIVLAGHPEVSSRSEAQRIIKSGNISLNHSTDNLSAKKQVHTGDLIEFSVLPPPETDLVAVPFDLDIVFEDDYIIVINKPSGMVVHPSAGHSRDTLVNYLLHHSTLSNKSPIRPGIVHRIDKDTSGLLVIAKDNASHENLARQFYNHSISRQYEAIVWGTPERLKGTVDKPLGRHPKERKKFAVRKEGKRAVTHWKVVRSYVYLSLIECTLETGRTHQIRIHMSSIGHPLLGDPVYGRQRNYSKGLPAELVKMLKQFEGQALHAKSLGFKHPKTKESLVYHSRRPDAMERLIEQLEIHLKKS